MPTILLKEEGGDLFFWKEGGSKGIPDGDEMKCNPPSLLPLL